MKIVFFGTSEFAVPVLQKLANSNYEIAAVITQPDKPAGRKQFPLPSPVKIAARELQLNVVQPQKLEIENWKLKIPEADLYIVASYGKIIPKSVLDIPKFGALNIHPSLLPKYRGPSPIQAAILNGDTETGVTIMKLDEAMDHGPVLESRKWKIENTTGFRELHNKLARLGADLLLEVLPKYTSAELKPAPQDQPNATYTKIINKDDARIDWAKSAEKIDRQIRAYESWPVAWTTLNGKRLKIFKSLKVPLPGDTTSEPGSMQIDAGGLEVSCGSGLLKVLELQLEGSKRLSISEFLKGYHASSSEKLI